MEFSCERDVLVDPMLISEEYMYRNVVKKYSVSEMPHTKNTTYYVVKCVDLERIDLIPSAIEKKGHMRYVNQRDVDPEHAKKIADTIFDRLKHGLEITDMEIKIGTVSQQNPKVMDGQHRLVGLHMVMEHCKLLMKEFAKVSDIRCVVLLEDFNTEKERRSLFKQRNDNRPLNAIYKDHEDESKQTINDIRKQFVEKIRVFCGQLISEIPYMSEYDEFVSSFINSRVLDETTHAFVKKYIGTPHLPGFLEKIYEILEKMSFEYPSVYVEHFNMMSMSGFPKGCMGMTLKGEKCKNSINGKCALLLANGTHGLCHSHIHIIEGKTPDILYTEYCQSVFMKRLDNVRKISSNPPYFLMYKLGEQENWLDKAFIQYLNTQPLIQF